MTSIARNCRIFAAAGFVAGAIAVSGCGGGGEPDTVDSGSANPASALTFSEAKVEVKEAGPDLTSIREEANAILDDGIDGFDQRLAELEAAGVPVVVNKWASWCGPCRHEFPFFQRQVVKRGKQIAFLAVNSEDAREPAQQFLGEIPVPYPSFLDPDSDIAQLLGLPRNFPITTFYDRRGERIYTKPGGYATEAALADDVREYAIAAARTGAAD